MPEKRPADEAKLLAALQAELVTEIIRTAKKPGRAALSPPPSHLPPELQARIDHTRSIATAAKPVPYEEWRTRARVAVFIEYRCKCGNVMRVFSHTAYRQTHHRLSSHRITREPSSSSMPVAPLPKELVEYSRTAELCDQCAVREGFRKFDEVSDMIREHNENLGDMP